MFPRVTLICLAPGTIFLRLDKVLSTIPLLSIRAGLRDYLLSIIAFGFLRRL